MFARLRLLLYFTVSYEAAAILAYANNLFCGREFFVSYLCVGMAVWHKVTQIFCAKVLFYSFFMFERVVSIGLTDINRYSYVFFIHVLKNIRTNIVNNLLRVTNGIPLFVLIKYFVLTSIILFYAWAYYVTVVDIAECSTVEYQLDFQPSSLDLEIGDGKNVQLQCKYV